MTDPTIRMPIICPTCNGTGLCRGMEGYICPQCHGSGEVGYAERTQAEIDAASVKDDRREAD